ncbi:MAG: hypothetical protein ACOC44_09035 [Promethearchaeia archaeon]
MTKTPRYTFSKFRNLRNLFVIWRYVSDFSGEVGIKENVRVMMEGFINCGMKNYVLYTVTIPARDLNYIPPPIF